jgi:hypothetical protein
MFLAHISPLCLQSREYRFGRPKVKSPCGRCFLEERTSGCSPRSHAAVRVSELSRALLVSAAGIRRDLADFERADCWNRMESGVAEAFVETDLTTPYTLTLTRAQSDR